MAAWRYEISLLVLKKCFTRSLRPLGKYFSTLEDKFCISARPCIIILYIPLQTAIKRFYLFLFLRIGKRNKGLIHFYCTRGQCAPAINWLTSGPFVQKVDNAIYRINLYPLDSAIGFPNTYPLHRSIRSKALCNV